MSDRLEDTLRDGLHARAAGHDLAPGAVVAATAAGRRRLRRRRAVAGGGLALVVAAGVAVGVGWEHDAKGRSVVTADQSDPQPAEGAEVGPALLVRSYEDNFTGLFETLKGKLAVSEEGCVSVEGADGSRHGIVFGPEWTAGDDDGEAAVYNVAGKVFARDGKKVTLYGGPATKRYEARYGDDPCWVEDMFLANSNQGGLPYRDVKRSEMRIQPAPPDPNLNSKSPASEVVAVVAEHIYRLGEETGYAGLRVDAKTRSVAVLWKGRPPAEVREYVASRPYGVEITVDEGARYSDAELKGARTRVLGSDIGVLLEIVSTDLNNDGSGFEIGVRGDVPPTAEQMAQLRAVAGMDDISVRTGVEPYDGWLAKAQPVPGQS